MEHKYRLNPWKIRIYWLIPLVTLALVLVLYIVVFKHTGMGLINDLISIFCFSGVFMYASIKGYMFYRKANSIVISVDDVGISQEENGTITSISWEDVTQVNWGQSPIKGIQIKTEDKQITIGKDIEGFPQIIRTTKLMVGDRFNTYFVPWKLKNP